MFYFEQCASTMDEARRLEKEGAPHGSVIRAGVQSAGRGRVDGRRWQALPNESLLFTLLLRYKDFSEIPKALTLKTGLAVALAIEKIFPTLQEKAKIKWPNDIMLGEKKVCGILTESDCKNVFCGIGINVFKEDFEGLPNGTSVYIEQKSKINLNAREAIMKNLLESILEAIKFELEDDDWNMTVSSRLFRKGRQITFYEAGSGDTVQGILHSIADSGALIIMTKDGPRHCVAGELETARP